MKRFNMNYLKAGILLLTLFLMAAPALKSAAPADPSDLNVRTGNGYGMKFITFEWKFTPKPDHPDGFKIYKAEGETDDFSDFTEWRDLAISNNPRDSLIIQKNFAQYMYMFDSNEFPDGKYSFVVTAYNDDGESGTSNFVTVEIKTPVTVRFTSDDAFDGIINEEIEIDFDAEASDGSDLKYELKQTPDDAEIDENTGVFKWTPDKAGLFIISLRASLADDPKTFAHHVAYIYVASCKELPVLKGTVSYADGTPVETGYAVIYPADVKDSIYNQHPNRQAVIEDGKFELKVDKGEYIVMVQGKDFEPEFYEDASGIRDAKSIEFDCGETKEITIKVNKFDRRHIAFTSRPETIGFVGEEYSYDADAFVYPDTNEVINYELIEAPAGMTIDEETGLIKWTPAESGIFNVAVKAFIKDNPNKHALQKFPLHVHKCKNHPYIIANVKDQKGNKINHGMATIVIKEGGRVVPVTSAVIKNGFMHAPLDEGTFYVFFQGNDFRPEWYDDAEDIENAKGIEVECGDTVIINVEVYSHQAMTFHNVSGQVLRQKNQTPVAFGFVDFFGREKETDMHNVFRTVFYNGEYQIQLPEGWEFIARAAPVKNDSLSIDPEMLPMYYNQTMDVTEATAFEVKEDRDDINFLLEDRPEFNNELSGRVKDENGVLQEGAMVVAFLVEPAAFYDEMIYYSTSMQTDENGEFYFTSLVPGRYVLFALTMDRKLVPGFYVKDANAVMHWQEADRILVELTGDAGDYEIQLGVRSRMKGNGRIFGWIFGRRGGEMKADKVLGGDPLAGAVVYAVDEDGNVIDYRTSNEDGSFDLDELQYGDYKLVVDKVGYDPIEQEMTVDEENNNLEANMQLDGIISSVDDNDEISDTSVYPNPANSSVNVAFSGSLGRALIKVVNTEGIPVLLKTVNSVNGMNNTSISVDNIPSGSYYIVIENNTEREIIPLSVVK